MYVWIFTRGPRVARLVGVPFCDGVQRQHRRVEHRACHHVVLGMRRLFRPGRRATEAGGARRVVDAARAVVRRIHTRRSARACVCVDAWALACAGVPMRRYSCTYKRRDVCIYLCVCIYYVCIIHVYIGIFVLVREMGMGVHAAASPRTHTCVRLRAPTMRPSPSRARVRGYVRWDI
jgi:hypothetical protein